MKNKDKLACRGDQRMSAKPAANKDQYGSVHNEDLRKRAQEQRGRPKGKGQDLAFRESGQDLQPQRGEKNKQEGRRGRNSGEPREGKGKK